MNFPTKHEFSSQYVNHARTNNDIPLLANAFTYIHLVISPSLLITTASCSFKRTGGCREWASKYIRNKKGTSFTDCEDMCMKNGTCGGFMMNSNNQDCTLLKDVKDCTTAEANKAWMKLYECERE